MRKGKGLVQKNEVADDEGVKDVCEEKGADDERADGEKEGYH